MAFDHDIKEAHQLRARGNRDGAADIFKRILKRDLNNPDGLYGLAIIAAENHNFDAARDIFLRALKADPERAHIWADFAKVLHNLKDPAGAERALQNALNLDPDFAPAYLQLGLMALAQGETEKAISLLEKSLQLNPVLDASLLHLAKHKPIRPGDPMAQTMLRLAEDPAQSPRSKSNLHFALAYVFERAGDADAYFSHLEKANRLQIQADTAWRENIESQFEKTRKLMTPEFLSARVSDKMKKYTPLFIVGLPRSGKTVTEQILGAHSQVFSGDELPYFIKFLSRSTLARSREDFPDGGEQLTPQDLEDVALAYQGRAQTYCRDKAFMTDTMPWNFQNIGMIYKILPWAKVVHVRRDPVDCGFCNYRNPLSSEIQFACDFDGYAYYRSVYQKFMDLWKSLVPGFVIDIQYEELVAQPEREIRRLIDFCGLPWEDGLLAAHDARGEAGPLGLGQALHPLNRDSIGYAKKYGARLKPLADALKAHGVA